MKKIVMILVFICFIVICYAVNNALEFDGDNDYVQTSYGEEIKTFEFWFNTNSFNTLDGLFGQRYDNAEESGNWQMHWDNNGDHKRLRIYSYDPTGGEMITTTSFETGSWYHIAITSEVDNVNYYVNGVHDSQHTWMSVLLGGGGNDDNLTIGGSFGNSTLYPFDGVIDEVRVWSVIRTQIQIQDNMYNELNGDEPGLVAYYKLNEESGQIAYDSAGIYNGELGNSPTPDLADPTWILSDAPLPVTLSSFNAAYINSASTLSWTTQSENSNLGWNVYRSETEDFTNTSVQNTNLIEGAGTTSEPTDYSFADPYPVTEGSDYWFWLESISFSGESEIFGPVALSVPNSEPGQNPPIIPETFGLYQNYPNPFNPSTEISFAVEEAGKCELTIYDLKGRKVKTLFHGNIEPERIYNFLWNGKDEDNKPVSSGMYFYKMQAGKYSSAKKMILLK